MTYLAIFFCVVGCRPGDGRGYSLICASELFLALLQDITWNGTDYRLALCKTNVLPALLSLLYLYSKELTAFCFLLAFCFAFCFLVTPFMISANSCICSSGSFLAGCKGRYVVSLMQGSHSSSCTIILIPLNNWLLATLKTHIVVSKKEKKAVNEQVNESTFW